MEGKVGQACPGGVGQAGSLSSRRRHAWAPPGLAPAVPILQIPIPRRTKSRVATQRPQEQATGHNVTESQGHSGAVKEASPKECTPRESIYTGKVKRVAET